MAAFTDPSSPSTERVRQHTAKLLRFLIWLSLLSVIGYTVFSPIDPSLMPQRLIIVVPLIAALLAAFWLLRQQRVEQASLLVISSLWLILIGSATISGGILAPAFAALPTVVVMAGMLFGQRGAWIVAILSIATGVIFTLLADWLPQLPIPHSRLSWSVTYTLYLLLSAYIIDQLISHFRQSLRETDKELHERRTVEKQLRDSEEKLARLFDSAPFAMLIVRINDELILNANAACREFFELSSEQIIKQPIRKLSRSQLPERWPAITEALEQQGTISGVEFSFQRNDRTSGFAQLAAELIELPEGLCAVVAFQDVTPLRHANERLAELAARQEQLATLAREALANTDLNTLFAAAVAQTAQTLRLSGTELVELDLDHQPYVRAKWGNVPEKLLPSEVFRDLPNDHPGWNQLPPILAERIGDVAMYGAGMPIRGKERLFGALLAYAQHPLDTEAIFFLHSVANVLAVAIERFNAEQERRRIETQMLQTQKLESLGLLAGGIAHDFNNLLTSIMGHTSLALLDLPSNHALQPHLAAIDQASQRAAELCSQLLACAGRGQRSLESVDLSALVREMGNLLRLPASRSSQVTITYDLAPDLPAIVVEASQIRQVVLNLLTNAIEAIGERSGTVTISTNVTTLTATDLRRLNLTPSIAAGKYVTLTVSDTGIGMDEATQRRIFDPFFSTKPKGHGLGLAAVQDIVRRHYGAIRVESTPGLGSTFTVYLPAANTTTPTMTAVATTPIILTGTALIVDDDAAVRGTISRILERAGMVTLEAVDGRTAFTLLSESAISIDIALIDLAMPGMNGLELLEAIRRHSPRLPVLLMSGNAEQITSQPLPINQYTDFLPKPYRSRDLLEKISLLIQRATSVKANNSSQ
ncbi:ATP-binding protein [uncultured Chloroflexus sp.]|uniref:hybrid sensor histidine kinase/response regulator n=1 Tax=uncultured Chloroflexus sp. TaxID=214040 RepID=UPI00260CD23C|nr:ATP-binding protein [uncultured Chloroflexus sp.]